MTVIGVLRFGGGAAACTARMVSAATRACSVTPPGAGTRTSGPAQRRRAGPSRTGSASEPSDTESMITKAVRKKRRDAVSSKVERNDTAPVTTEESEESESESESGKNSTEDVEMNGGEEYPSPIPARTHPSSLDLSLPPREECHGAEEEVDAPHDPPRDPVPTAAGAPTGDWRSVYAAALCHRVTSGPFTHDIGEVRVNLTDHGLAAAVYAQAAAFVERGLAITERRLSAVVRLRVEVRFDRALTPDSFGPDRTYRAVTNAVRGALVPCLAPGARGPVHRYLTCFVARPALVDGGFDRLWFHFPGIAAAFHDLKRLSGPIEASVTEAVEGAACTVLSVVGSSHPLYACDPRTMGVVGVITGHPEADALEFTAA